MKKLLFIALASVFLFSCSNDDNTSSGPKFKTITTSSNQVIITNYDNGRPVEILSSYNGGTPRKTTFEYNSQGLLSKENFYDEGDAITQHFFTYEYNNEQRLINIIETYNYSSGESVSTENPYYYNTDNTIGQGADPQHPFKKFYVDIEGRIHKVTYTVAENIHNVYSVAADIRQFDGENNPLVYTSNGRYSDYTVTIQYDNEHDKSLLYPDVNDPVKRINEILIAAFDNDYFSWSQIETTKYVTQLLTTVTGEGSPYETITNYNYTFNELGLPIKMEEFRSGYDMPYGTTEYIYE